MVKDAQRRENKEEDKIQGTWLAPHHTMTDAGRESLHPHLEGVALRRPERKAFEIAVLHWDIPTIFATASSFFFEFIAHHTTTVTVQHHEVSTY